MDVEFLHEVVNVLKEAATVAFVIGGAILVWAWIGALRLVNNKEKK